MALRFTIDDIFPKNMALQWTQPRGMPPPYPLSVVFNIYWDTAADGRYTSHFMYGEPTGLHIMTTFYSALATPVDFRIGMHGTESGASGVRYVNRWATQGFRSVRPGSDMIGHYFYDLPDVSKVVTATGIGNSITLDSTFSMMLGSNPWTGFEGTDGRFGPCKIWTCALPDWAFAAEARSIYPVLPQYRKYLWCNVRGNSVEDILDLSGNGHHPIIYSPSGDPPTAIGSNPLQSWQLKFPLWETGYDSVAGQSPSTTTQELKTYFASYC